MIQLGVPLSIPELTKPLFPPMRDHPEQQRLVRSICRYDVAPPGRRSGKTEIVGKRRLIYRALLGSPYPDPRYFVGAPTRDQARRIYWNDLKRYTKPFWARTPSETQLVIPLITGSEIHVLGMDKPERIEGTPWDGGVLDEYGNMKKETWTEHVRPALSDRKGWCSFIGVPEGRNHYYDLFKDAKQKNADAIQKGLPPIWDTFHWFSADILDAEEIALAKEDLDELTFQQEYEGSFINFQGRTYYAFLEETHVDNLYQHYNSNGDLILCFDFNIAPGVASIAQEMLLDNIELTALIGEVYIKRNSNTLLVCDKIINDWGDHQGRVFCYGDPTGGAGGTAKVLGSDWDLIRKKLDAHFGNRRVFYKYRRQLPRERDRVNAVNSRLRSVDGIIRMKVDGARCPYTIKDFEGVQCIEGGSGEIDKKINPELTHLTDANGYYIEREYPVKGKRYTLASQEV